MNFSNINIKKEFHNSVARIGNRLSRARYFRGHGVHSPFVYTIVREVFMRTELLPGDHSLYEELLKRGVKQRRAIQLQNLFLHNGYTTFCIDGQTAEFCVLTRRLAEDRTVGIVEKARVAKQTVAILDPYEDNDREGMCRRIVHTHPCTSVDNRAYLLIFNNHLPKQQFRI